MRFKYDLSYYRRQVETILEILGTKKELRFNQLRNAVADAERMRKLGLNFPPRQLSLILNALGERKIIERNKRSEFEILYKLSPLGHFFVKQGYDVTENRYYENFLKVCQKICFLSIDGTYYENIREGPAEAGDFQHMNDPYIRYTVKKEGVSISDILSHETIELEASFPNTHFTENELREYFDFLITSHVIKYLYTDLDCQRRYVICPPYSEIFTSLFTLFDSIYTAVIELKLSYVKGPTEGERYWLEQYMTKRKSDLYRIGCYENRKKIFNRDRLNEHSKDKNASQVFRDRRLFYENHVRNIYRQISDEYSCFGENFENHHEVGYAIAALMFSFISYGIVKGKDISFGKEQPSQLSASSTDPF